jgi:Rod binding domain-containing protein
MKIDNYSALMSLNSVPNIIKTDNDTKLKEQTDKFEAFFIKKILDVSIKSNNMLFPKSAGEDIYNSMYNDAMSNKLSGHFGFSELLFNYLKKRG